MPTHDWTRVEAGIFHHFHHEWISAISRALNHGLLPPDHYALAEQIAGSYGPDVLTLQGPSSESRLAFADQKESEPRGGIALAEIEPKVSFIATAEEDVYARKAKQVVVHHVSNHRVVAVVEIVSPGNKSSAVEMRNFVEKAGELIRAGVHLLVIDLFSPGPRDPSGIHKLIWDEFVDQEFVLPPSRPLVLASYVAGAPRRAFVEPVAVGKSLPKMPLFLTPRIYIEVPLESTYEAAWDAVPAYWQNVLSGPQNETGM